MTVEALNIGEQVLALLEDAATSSTYKPALLVAILDRVPEHLDDGRIPVRELAERALELYWPQSRPYASSGRVLIQNQSGGQAGILRELSAFRVAQGAEMATLPDALRTGADWSRLVDRTERTLAEWPIPRLQRPFEPFLYPLDWPFKGAGSFSMKAYRDGGAAIRLLPGVPEALVRLAPLLRPFIVRWWTEKAATLNRDVAPDALSLAAFEDFLFGQDRVALGRVADGLLAMQGGTCFYCAAGLDGRDREVDHFIPWSRSGDDGLDNLVVACPRCNNAKRAALAGPRHLEAFQQRNVRHTAALGHLSVEKRWARNAVHTATIVRTSYLHGASHRLLWEWEDGWDRGRLRPFVVASAEVARLLADH